MDTGRSLVTYETNTGSAGVAKIDTYGAFYQTQFFDLSPTTAGYMRPVATANGVLFYNPLTGRGAVGYVNYGGEFTQVEAPLLSTGWTKIVATDNGLLFYNAATGSATVGRIDRNGRYSNSQTFAAGSLSKGWSHIVATGDSLLFYDVSTGSAAIGNIDHSGKFAQTSAARLSASWSKIVVVGDDILFYNEETGSAAIGNLNRARGTFEQTQSLPNAFSTGWTHIVAVAGER